MSTTLPLSVILTRCSQLVAHSRQLTRLQRLLANALPADLAHHCQVQNLRGATLYLQTDSSVWANRLRYLRPALLQQLQPELGTLHDIQVTVAPVQATPPHSKRRAKLSDSAAQILLETAESTTDPQLRAAFKRLAGNTQRD